MQLHYKKSGQGPPVIILHGLLGMSDNWQSVGRILSSAFEVYLFDARNHGHSSHSDEFSYDLMAEDLRELTETEDSLRRNPAVLIGHSMGGKTAMKFAQKYPEKVEKLIIVDIAPKPYAFSHQEIFNALSAIDFTLVKSRKQAEEIFSVYISESSTRQFLLKNLYWKNPGELGWRFNLEAIKQNAAQMGEATQDAIFYKPVLFIRGEQSGYITEEDIPSIKKYFPSAEIKTVAGAGHWVHADQPEQFVQVVKEFLSRQTL